MTVVFATLKFGVTAVSAEQACSSFATSSVCNQQAYDSCSGPYYDGNRAYYDCRASQDPNRCTGKIYCGSLDKPAAGNPSPVNVPLTCDAVNKKTTCGQPTYDTCTKRFDGNKAYYDCSASQNSSCQGTYRCESEDQSSNGGGANANANASCPSNTISQGVNSQGTLICVSNANANANNNNNTSNSNSASNATGGTAIAYGGAGGSSNVTITNQAVQREVRVVNSGNVGVGTKGGVTQLPKTGLPLMAWAAAGLVPAGLRMRKMSQLKKEAEGNANFIFEDRNFKIGS